MELGVRTGQLPGVLRRRRARPVVNVISRLFTAVEIRLYRSGRKTVGSRIVGGAPVLLLISTGRRTGKRRVTPLLYQREENGDLLLVAANGGADWNPQWFHNLRATPEAEVEIDRDRVPVVASVLSSDERMATWSLAERVFPSLRRAQAVTTRPIPLVRLLTGASQAPAPEGRNDDMAMMVTDKDYFYFAERALDGMVAIVAALGDERANARPDLPGANTPYAILTHCLGVAEYWAGHLVAGREVVRDRDAEFTAAGPVSELLQRVEAAKRQLRADVAAADAGAPLRHPPPAAYLATRPDLTQGAALQHVYEELAQHHGQMEITRDLIVGYEGGGP